MSKRFPSRKAEENQVKLHVQKESGIIRYVIWVGKQDVCV